MLIVPLTPPVAEEWQFSHKTFLFCSFCCHYCLSSLHWTESKRCMNRSPKKVNMFYVQSSLYMQFIVITRSRYTLIRARSQVSSYLKRTDQIQISNRVYIAITFKRCSVVFPEFTTPISDSKILKVKVLNRHSHFCCGPMFFVIICAYPS